MVEKAAEDYSKLLQGVNLDKEINPMILGVEDMLTRLDELETLLVNVKAENNIIMDHYAGGILSFAPHFENLKDRIDKLENFVETVNTNVNEVERCLDTAEEELNVTDYSLKGLLIKPLLAKAKSSGSNSMEPIAPESNIKDDVFQPVTIFKTSDFFEQSSVMELNEIE